MCSPRNDKYNPSYSRTYLSIKCLLRTWFLCFGWISFFLILRSWKARFSHRSISPDLCTNEIMCLEFSNRVRNWNNVKVHFRLVETWIMPIGNTNIHVTINLSESINRRVSILFCEFNRVTSWKECKHYFRTFIFSNSQIELLVSFSR